MYIINCYNTSIPSGFFPFGTIVEDKMIPGAIDGSEDITPDFPFAIPFYQNMESKLFVS